MAIGKLLKLSAVVLAVWLHGIQWNVDDPAQYDPRSEGATVHEKWQKKV